VGAIVYVDGPEKAGKTTLVNALADRLQARVRHWGPVSPDDRVYAPVLREDVEGEGVVIWDRGWVAEHVYAALLGRTDRRIGTDPWLGEWLHGRVLRTVGVGLIVLGRSAELLRERRDVTDLPVDPGEERAAFLDYARRFRYRTVLDTVTHFDSILSDTVDQVFWVQRRVQSIPPVYCGPVDAKVMVVGERRAGKTPKTIPGGWLPFTSEWTTQFGRLFGDAAVTSVGWTNAADCPPQSLRSTETLVTCGEAARRWAEHYVNHPNIVAVPHPSWLYRWGKARGQVQRIEDRIRYLTTPEGENNV